MSTLPAPFQASLRIVYPTVILVTIMKYENILKTLSKAELRIRGIEDPVHKSILQDEIKIINKLLKQDLSETGKDLNSLLEQMRHAELTALTRSLADQISAMEQRKGEKKTILNLRAFGAEGDNETDDGPAFAAAFAALAKLPGKAVLHIDEGTYRISSFRRPDIRSHLHLENLNNVVIRGEGPLKTVVVGTQTGTLLRMEACMNVTIRSIGFDFDPLPFTQGHVVSVNKESSSIDWQVQKGWPTTEEWLPEIPYRMESHLPFGSGSPRAEGTGRFLRTGNFPISRIQNLGNGKNRLYMRIPWWKNHAEIPPIKPGTPMTLHSRNIPGKQPALWITSNRFCELRDVAIYASWHHAYLICDNEAQRCINCSCEPKPGSGRLAVTNADGFHIRSNRIGPHITGCRIRCTNDDTSNFYSRAVSVNQTLGTDTLVVEIPSRPEYQATDWQADPRSYKIGDQVGIINPQSGAMEVISRITAIEETWWRGVPRLQFFLADDIPPLITRERLGKTHPVTHNMEFFSITPEEITEHMLINLSLKSDGFILTDSHFGENHINGIKLKGSNGIIRGNLWKLWEKGIPKGKKVIAAKISVMVY